MSGGRLFIEGADARHLCLVRRARPKDRIQAGDGRGRVVEAAIESVSGDRVEAAVLQEHSTPRPVPDVTVLQGLARQIKIDFAVQKLAELGVDRIVVFEVNRSVPRWDEDKKDNVRRRWERICHEASKQSRRAWLPEVEGPVEFVQAVEASRKMDLCFVADPESETSLRAALSGGPPGSVGVVIGPEGGLEAREVAEFSSAGGTPVSIGGQILRTETAGLAIAAVLMFHFGRLG